MTRRVPERWGRAAFRRLADLAWRRRVRGVQRLEQNLRRVAPTASARQLRALSYAGMQSYFRYWYECFRLPVWRREEILGRVVVHEEERFRAALAEGRGVVAALPHQANWDLAGAWACATGTPLTTIAERLRPERLYKRFVAYRERLGIEVLPADGEVDRLGVLADRLRAGGLVCLVADRDLSARGVNVRFFGEVAKMPAGPAALALRTGATLLPVTLWYDARFMHVHFGEPIRPEQAVQRPPESESVTLAPDGATKEPGTGNPESNTEIPGRGGSVIEMMTQRLADAFAEGIEAHPTDWHMLQRLWLADLGAATKPAADSGHTESCCTTSVTPSSTPGSV